VFKSRLGDCLFCGVSPLLSDKKKSVDSIVAIMTRIQAGLPRNRASISGREKGLFFSKASSPGVVPTQPSALLSIRGAFPGNKSGDSRQFGAEFKNAWKYTYFPPTRLLAATKTILPLRLSVTG
jgi:hypothetical protein